MKKWFTMITIGLIALFLSACQSDDESSDSEVIVETEYGTITQAEFYEALESQYGEETLRDMTKRLVLESQFEVDDEEFEEEIEMFKSQLGPQFNEFIQQQNFRNEEEFRVALYLSKLEFEAATADIEVTDEEVQQRYDRLQEERLVRHILVDELETAEEVIDRYNEGDSFEDLAAEYSNDGTAASGGNLGYASAGEMVEPFENAMYELEVGELSEPVESEFGWHVILVEEVREAEVELEPFEDMKEQLREQILAGKVDPTSYNESVQNALDNGNINILDDKYEDIFETQG